MMLFDESSRAHLSRMEKRDLISREKEGKRRTDACSAYRVNRCSSSFSLFHISRASSCSPLSVNFLASGGMRERGGEKSERTNAFGNERADEWTDE